MLRIMVSKRQAGGQPKFQCLKYVILSLFVVSFPCIGYSAGVTIITHGWLLDKAETPTWLKGMSDEIASRIVAEHNSANQDQSEKSEVAQLWFKIGRESGELTTSKYLDYFNGFDPNSGTKLDAIKQSLDGEVVVMLDWEKAAGQDTITAAAEFSTVEIAEYFYNHLVGSDIGKLLISMPIHLIGHSRGGSVLGALAENLGRNGIWVDQVTFLDPHPTENGWNEDDWGEDAGNGLKVPNNVVFADNYWRKNGLGPPFDGEFVNGATNTKLNEDYFDNYNAFDFGDNESRGYGGLWADAHSDVHAWYHGTIPKELPQLPESISDGVVDIDSSWYVQEAYETDQYPGVRDQTGYSHSRISGGIGRRPLSSGLSGDFNGCTGATRYDVSLSGDQWPNIGYFSGIPSAVQKGESFTFSYLANTTQDSNATLVFYLDKDKNPYNGVAYEIGRENVTNSTTPYEQTATVSISTSVENGDYYIYGRTTTTNGRARGFYSWKKIKVVDAPISNSPPTLTNVSVSQRTDGSGIVDISYTLTDVDGDACTISVVVSDDSGNTWSITPSTSALSGHVGPSVNPGSRHIEWTSKTDLPGVYGTNYGVRVTADDGNITPLQFVSINDPGVAGHEGFIGQMSKYETTNAQYCQYLNAALATSDITVSGNDAVGANGTHSGTDYVGLPYYNGDGPGGSHNGATHGGASRIHYSAGVFSVDPGFNDHPVTYVSWYGATAFATHYGYRLPTEWEWQAVADYDGSYTYGCGTNINNAIANYENSTHPDGTTPVGSFGVYGYGMGDMAGNLWEWTDDIHSESTHVIRGGSWFHYDDLCTVSFRNYEDTYWTSYVIGFRVCR